jgi:hypothetical protein
MEKELKLPPEVAKSFLDLIEKLKEFRLSDLELKNLGINNLKVIQEGTSYPWLVIKYLDGTKETIKGIENVLNKLKEFVNGKS